LAPTGPSHVAFVEEAIYTKALDKRAHAYKMHSMRKLLAFPFLMVVLAVFLAGCSLPGAESATATPTPKPPKATATRTPRPKATPTDAAVATVAPKSKSGPSSKGKAPTAAPAPTDVTVPTAAPEPTVATVEQSWPKTDLLRSSTWKTTDQSYYRDGQLHVVCNIQGNYFMAYSKIRDFGDFVLETEVTKVGGPDDWGYGLVFQIREAADEFVLFEISGDGHFAAEFNSKDSWISLIAWTATPAINKGNATNKLKLAVQGNTAEFYVNEQLLARQKITPGRGYVGAYSGEKDLHIVLSSLDLYAPD
jgi:hypothetical protein